MCARACARVCVFVRVCARACMHACACIRDVFAIYDNIFDPG